MRDLIIGGLLLPLRLYFQPTKFVDEVAALAPDLPRDYSLWQARHKLREPDFRRGLWRLVLQSLIALLWAPLLACLLSNQGYEIAWAGVAGGVALGMAVGMAVSMAVSMAVGMAVGMALGLESAMAFGMALGSTWDVAGIVAASVLWGMVVGVVGRVVSGVADVVLSGVVGGVAVGLLGIVWGGMVWGVVVGLLWGAAGSGAFSVTCILMTTHLLILPFKLASASSVGWSFASTPNIVVICGAFRRCAGMRPFSCRCRA